MSVSRSSSAAITTLRQTLEHHTTLLSLSESSPAVRRDAASNILATIADFLEQQQQEEQGESVAPFTIQRKKGDFPTGILRTALSSLVVHIGNGDRQLRTFLLEQLIKGSSSSSATQEARQLLLDFLPATMPVMHPQHQHFSRTKKIGTAAAAASSKIEPSPLESATQEVIGTLRHVLSKDPSALLPVIGCLSSTPLSQSGQNEAFQVALSSLEFVAEIDLPMLVTSLLQHAASDEDAIRAIEALRTELYLMETTATQEQQSAADNNNNNNNNNNKRREDPTMTMVAHVVLNSLFADDYDNDTDGNHHRIAKAYSSCLERLVDARLDSDENDKGRITDTFQRNNTNQKEHDETNQFLLLDIVLLLSLYHHPNYRDSWERHLDSLLQHNRFPFASLSNLVVFLCGETRYGRPASILYPRLVQSLVSLSIFLLLSPARMDNVRHQRFFWWTRDQSVSRSIMKEIMDKSQDFAVNLHRHVDREVQSELVHSLLHLSDKCASMKWKVSSGTRGKLRKRHRGGNFQIRDNMSNDNEDRVEWFQVIINDTINSTLRKMVQTDNRSFGNFKHVIIGRLTNQSFQSTEWERQCIQHLCGILSVLIEPSSSGSAVDGENNNSNNSGGIQASEIMIILQKLMFTSPHSNYVCNSPTSSHRSHSGDTRRVVRGLLLSTELVKSSLLSHGDWDCVKHWVLRVLLPTTRRMVDPEIGIPGLSFLEALMIDRNSIAIDADRPGTSLLLQKEAFQHMKMVLANTGLIQILAHYRQQHQNRQGRVGAPILSYTKAPGELFLTESAKKRKKRDMVFCLAFFLGNSDLHLPVRWDHCVNWVFRLVDTYLCVGRDISLSAASGKINRKGSSNKSWMPHGWLQAAIEFPALVCPRNIETNTKKQKQALAWMKGLIHQDEIRNEPTLGETRSGLVDAFSTVKEVAHLVPMFDSVLRVGLASLLGISLSFAVVKNSFKHFQSFASDQESMGERIEVLRLIQFQMFKIYDLEAKCKSVETVMRASLICIRKLQRAQLKSSTIARNMTPEQQYDLSLDTPETSDNGKEQEAIGTRRRLDEDTDIASRYSDHLALAWRQLGNLRERHFTSLDYVSLEVIFACLVDVAQDATIKDFVDDMIDSPRSFVNANSVPVLHLVRLRQHLLDHLLSALSSNETNTTIKRTWFASSVEIVVYLCSALPKLRKACHGHRNNENCYDVMTQSIACLLTLASSYLELIAVALSRASKLDRLVGSEQAASNTLFTEYIEPCSELFQSRDVSGNRIKQNNSKPLETSFAGFRRELEMADDSVIACRLLEILSVLALSSTENKLAGQIVTANWKAMHTIYVSSTQSTTHYVQPCTLTQAAASVTMDSCHGQKQIEKFLQETIFRQRTSDVDQFHPLRHYLLRHWGILVLCHHTADTCIGHFETIREELALLLQTYNELDRRVGLSVEEKKEDRQQGIQGLRSADLEGGQIHSSAGCTIPELHSTSFPIALETLLHVTVAAMGALSVKALNVGRGGKSQYDARKKESGPYKVFQSLLILFHSLVDLYVKNGHQFPTRIVATVFSAAKHMQSMTLNQVAACVQWRNTQPLLSMAERNIGCYDPGAVLYLQKFLDSCWTHLTFPVLAFCDAMSVPGDKENQVESKNTGHQTNRKRDDEGDEDYVDDDGNKADRAPSSTKQNLWNQQRYAAKANALRYTVEKTAVMLKDIASSHNLTTPDTVDKSAVSVKVLAIKRKIRGDHEKGFHQSKVTQLSSGRKHSKVRRLSLEDSDAAESEEDQNTPIEGQEKGDAGSLSGVDEEEDWDSQDDEGSDGRLDPAEDFGATGNWGKDDDSEASSSSCSLVMETALF